MTTLRNSFNGGTHGDTITVGASGGVSGTAFDDTSQGSQTDIFFDNAFPFEGGLGARFVANASANQNAYLAWNSSINAADDNTNPYYFEAHIYVPSGGITNEHPIIRGTTKAGGQCFRISIDTNRRIRARNAGNSTLSGTTTQLTTSTHYRVEARCICALSGSMEVRVYSAAGSLLETHGPFTSDLNTTGFGEARYGFGASISPAATLTAYIDAVGVSDTDWLGAWPEDAATAFIGWGVPIG